MAKKLELNIMTIPATIVPVNNNQLALQFRKTIILCDKNKNFFNDFITAAFDPETKITIPACVQFSDKLKAKQRLIQFGFTFETISKK